MAQEFMIRKNSVLPTLKMEIIDDGRYNFDKNILNLALQNAKITFSMKDEKNVLKISNAKAFITKLCDCDCNENIVIEYAWKPKDTNKEGVYEGIFEIEFGDDIYQDGITFPNGKLIVPIKEKLIIYIK